jgi:glycosyltransferase involved in cell wall biosynthesis
MGGEVGAAMPYGECIDIDLRGADSRLQCRLGDDFASPRQEYAVVVYGRRDHYQVALALHEAGALDRVFTDYYAPHWLVRLADRLDPPLGRKLRLRHHPSLSARYFEGDLFKKQLLFHYWGCRGLTLQQRYALLNDFLSDRAARYAIRHPQSGVICYSYYWHHLAQVRAAGLWTGIAIVFQVHPVAAQIRRILAQDRARTSLSYSPEPEELASSGREGGHADDHLTSLQQADGVITASSFTARGLIEAGVPAIRVRVVPYGCGCGLAETTPGMAADMAVTPSPAGARWERQRPLRILWVGQLAYRKAPHHLFDAVRRFSPGQVELSVVSHSAVPPELAALVPPNVTILNSVSDRERQEMYQTYHLLAMPSLVEGFGLVYMEALAEGLPVLCTTNTGGPDVITNGMEGFIVPPGDSDAIADAIEACLCDPGLLPSMSVAALTVSATSTWSRFRAGIRASLVAVEHGETKKTAEQLSSLRGVQI